jgi:hypothetical protein
MVDCLPNEITQTSKGTGLQRLWNFVNFFCIPVYERQYLFFVRHDQENKMEANETEEQITTPSQMTNSDQDSHDTSVNMRTPSTPSDFSPKLLYLKPIR